MQTPLSFTARSINCGDFPLLDDMPENLSMLDDPVGYGGFVQLKCSECSRHIFTLGNVPLAQRFMALRRTEPFWMDPVMGDEISHVPVETQFLLVELSSSGFLLLAPLVQDTVRCVLQGAHHLEQTYKPHYGFFDVPAFPPGEADLPPHAIQLLASTEDQTLSFSSVTGVFLAWGNDPYLLMEQAAKSVAAWLNIPRRVEKKIPAFVNCLGWCTWDAFYADVSHDKLREGLMSFRDASIQPRFLILDDGWLSTVKYASGETRLTSYMVNEKFPRGLEDAVKMAKEEFGIQHFLVWHAMVGYWGGVDASALPDITVFEAPRGFSAEISAYFGAVNSSMWGPVVGLVAPESVAQFFEVFHGELHRAGVDGVKVDAQSTLEGVAAGHGGRVRLARTYRRALESSSERHFAGSLLNCMSLSTDLLYSSKASTVTRTSMDFWPDLPETHGVHVFVNAFVSTWFGEFILPDWDMFQTHHAMGAFHAAARALSGGPIYLSDTTGSHDSSILSKLALPNGDIPRCLGVGRPTLDCLFHDSTREDIALKIFNYNVDAAVLGVFNARYHAEGTTEKGYLSTSVCPREVPRLEGEEFVVFSHQMGRVSKLDPGQSFPLKLASYTFDVLTLTPIRGGFAPIGNPMMYNSGGVICEKELQADGSLRLLVRGGGTLLIWAARIPALVQVDGRHSPPYQYDESTQCLSIHLAAADLSEITLAASWT